MMRVFMTMLCSLLAVCSVSARISRQEGTDGQAAIYRLPLFERAVRCTKYFEGWHSEKHHPYVGYGHRLLPGERYSARTMTKRQADALLRKDMRNFCAMFRQFGKDSLLLATLAYNVGPYRLLGSGKIPKSKLIRKLEAGDRNISCMVQYSENTSHQNACYRYAELGGAYQDDKNECGLSGQYARFQQGSEYSLEVTWKRQLTESISLQPSFQYIKNDNGDFTALSARLYVSF